LGQDGLLCWRPLLAGIVMARPLAIDLKQQVWDNALLKKI
jgi:hypothetical protein